MKRYSLEIDGRNIKVWAEKIRGTLWYHYQGQSYCREVQISRQSGKSASAADTSEVIAPMPGKVTKILAHVGQEVGVGQALVVMEAMKMEYTLTAGKDGKIGHLLCQAGDQVSLGQVLVRMADENQNGD